MHLTKKTNTVNSTFEQTLKINIATVDCTMTQCCAGLSRIGYGYGYCLSDSIITGR